MISDRQIWCRMKLRLYFKRLSGKYHMTKIGLRLALGTQRTVNVIAQKYVIYNKKFQNNNISQRGYFVQWVTLTKLRGLSPHANYTDRAAAACRRS